MGGILTTEEAISGILRDAKEKEKKKSQIAKELGIDDRTLFGMAQQEWQRSKPEEYIRAEHRGRYAVFWSKKADSTVHAIREEENPVRLHNLLDFSMRSSYRSLLEIDPTTNGFDPGDEIEEYPEQDYFGRTYSALIYNAKISRARRGEINPKEALEFVDQLSLKLLEYLELRPENDEVAILLRFKVRAVRLPCGEGRRSLAEPLARDELPRGHG